MKNPNCPYCRSQKVIKHGKTSTGNPRYRCRTCGKTWVLEKYEPLRPDISDIAEAYLNGRTCRDLVNIYHSSPLRINQKIREFLAGVPHWEDYLDASVDRHEPRVVFLVGRTFACSMPGSKNNCMFLAMAVDGLSSIILGYEIAKTESKSVWMTLLDRLNCRDMLIPSFVTNGSRQIEESIKTIFPYATLRINYHRAYRDKEVHCCLSRLPVNNKLIDDAIKVYNSMDNKNLSKFLRMKNDRRVPEILMMTQEDFIRRLRERIDRRHHFRIEGLSNSFQTRFEKFHMLKDDPYPVINGWLSLQMLSRLNIGFSRLSLYKQIPCNTSFKKFSCGILSSVMTFKEDSPLLKTFVIEIAARGLQLPIVYNKCEMKIDKCSLF